MIKPLTGNYVLDAISSEGGYFDGPEYHFEYASGLHGCGYLNMDPLFPFQYPMRKICAMMSLPFVGRFNAVVGSATGGITIATIVADQRHTPIMVWADKVGKDEFDMDIFAFERAGFAKALQGTNVLYVEDIMNTGGTSAKTLRLIKQAEGNVIGAACACNRGDATADSLGVPELNELSKVDMKKYEPEECPGCLDNVPMVTDLGHGKRFQTKNPTYQGGFRQLLAA
jgi:orotate phosphoribosyltransferase